MAEQRPGASPGGVRRGSSGTTVGGRYRLDRPLTPDLPGAEPWSATDTILDRPVRVDLIFGPHLTAVLDAARRAALVTESRLSRILQVAQDTDLGIIVTGEVEGRSLAELAAAGPLPPDQARAIIGEAASALEEARRRGLHHLVLRPQTVVVTPSGRVNLRGLAVDGALVGLADTPAHAASRRDAIDLIRLLYAALTGCWPAAPATTGALPTLTEWFASGDDDALADPDSGLPAAPTVGVGPTPPAELVPDIPADLDTLCAVTLGPHEDGPHSPDEVVRELEPWHAVHSQDLFRAVNSGRWPVVNGSTATSSSGKASAPARGTGTVDRPTSTWPVVASHAGAAAAPTPVPASAAAPTGPASAPPTESSTMTDQNKSTPDDGTKPQGDAEPSGTSPARQSVRSSFTPGEGAGTRLPGTPPPAIPPSTSANQSSAATSGTAAVGTGTANEPATGAVTAAKATSTTAAAASSTTADKRPAAADKPATPAPSGSGGGTRTPEWGLPFDSESRATPQPSRHQFDPTRWVLGAIGVGLVVVLVLAIGNVTKPWRSGSDTEAATTTTVQPTATPTDKASVPAEEDAAAPVVAPVIAGVTTIDPSDSDGEKEELIPRIWDGDPSTAWYTHTYNRQDFAGFKDAVGIAVTLAEPATVTAVTLEVNGSGGNVEVRATDAANPTAGEVLVSGPLNGHTVLTLSQPTVTQNIVLWFTSLSQTTDNKYRIEISELTVS